MSEKFIPEHIDPFRFAEQDLRLDGVVKIIDMHRLSASLSADNNPVAVSLEFGRDEQGVAFLKGHLHTNLKLQCQRCMEPFTYEIMSDFLLGIVSTLEEVDTLPEGYEPALAKNGQLALRELVEDELILNLPIIPRHEPDMCVAKFPLTDSGWEQGEGASPFHVLKSLKHKQK